MADKFLSAELEAEISQRASCGPWHSPDEFIRHTIKAADALSDIQAAITEGDAQIARGGSADAEEFLDQLEAELELGVRRETEG